MAFTYTEDLSVPIDYVRFHTGDVVEGENYLSDGIITSLVATTGSNNAAVIAAIKHIIARLSQPSFTADWLKVDTATALRGFQGLLKEKMREFGLYTTPVATAVNTYRPDSYQRETPEYAESPASVDEDEWP